MFSHNNCIAIRKEKDHPRVISTEVFIFTEECLLSESLKILKCLE